MCGGRGEAACTDPGRSARSVHRHERSGPMPGLDPTCFDPPGRPGAGRCTRESVPVQHASTGHPDRRTAKARAQCSRAERDCAPIGFHHWYGDRRMASVERAMGCCTRMDFPGVNLFSWAAHRPVVHRAGGRSCCHVGPFLNGSAGHVAEVLRRGSPDRGEGRELPLVNP